MGYRAMKIGDTAEPPNLLFYLFGAVAICIETHSNTINEIFHTLFDRAK